jgi:hypothetical protein
MSRCHLEPATTLPSSITPGTVRAACDHVRNHVEAHRALGMDQFRGEGAFVCAAAIEQALAIVTYADSLTAFSHSRDSSRVLMRVCAAIIMAGALAFAVTAAMLIMGASGVHIVRVP